MKVFALLTVIALMASSGSAFVPCYETCHKNCVQMNQECPNMRITVCDEFKSICLKMCTGVCNCVDNCANECVLAFVNCVNAAKAKYEPVTSCYEDRFQCELACQRPCVYDFYTTHILFPKSSTPAPAED
ncbi:hypothetical protein PoB_004523200 [Plakobranchus ocellatus]|uniref:Uncharacterized protein n=1 Tax=Plakobranchus ocellatus TaxID=259542 RepID=A0AAV4BH75_9GAST|nr:hypothetical protein PoB_004523200 [Plakobranchus ocellatus]